jgi:hypothetical protein
VILPSARPKAGWSRLSDEGKAARIEGVEKRKMCRIWKNADLEKESLKTFFYIAIAICDWQNATVIHLFRADRLPCLFTSFGGAISNGSA